MTFVKLSIVICTLLILTACNQSSEKEKLVDKIISDSIKLDSASESTMLNPNFDPEKICGFGIFKIGTSFDSSVGILLATKKYKPASFSKRIDDIKFGVDHIYDEGKYIISINKPKSTFDDIDSPEKSTWCKDSKVYLVKSYAINRLVIKNLYLTYYKDKLVNLSCEWSKELLDAIESKYGKADKEIRNIDQKPIYYAVHWLNNDIESGYTSLSMDFSVEIKGGFSFLSGCSRKEYNVQNILDKKNMKSELKDF